MDGYCFAQCTAGEGPIDFLFVIDDSGGMASTHDQLRSSISTFFSELEAVGVDYRVGIVTTDVDTGAVSVANCRNLGGVLQHAVTDAGCTPPSDAWISPSTAEDPAATFGCIVSALGSSGCGFEQPLDAIQYALSNSVNPGFLRPEADLVIVIVSTEDDCSAMVKALYDETATQYGAFTGLRCFTYGLECEGGPDVYTNCRTRPAASGGALYPISRFSSQLEAAKGSLARVKVHALVGPASPVGVADDGSGQLDLVTVCPVTTVDVKPAVRIRELLDAVGGTLHSLCNGVSSAWPAVLEGMNVSEGCRSGYQCAQVAEGAICEPM